MTLRRENAFLLWMSAALVIALGILLVQQIGCGPATGMIYVHTVTVDGHEYIVYDKGGIVHKANCKAEMPEKK